MKYRPEIDGLRAVAVLPVIFFHAGFSFLSGGYIGVDVFFVISGYLITSIILSEKEAGKFMTAGFYERRARRILPALTFVALVCLPFAYYSMLPADLKEFSQSLIAVSLFSSNIFFWLKTGYFMTAAELKPLLHTWSLAVEEQYYLVFPLFIILTRRFRKRIVITLLAMFWIASILLAQWGSGAQPSQTFYLIPTRLWEILTGSFVAFFLFYESGARSRYLALPRFAYQALSLLGFLLIVYSIAFFNNKTPFPSFYTLVPTIGTVLIILFASAQTLVGRLLSTRFFVLIGLISYSAYLWHQPIFAFARLMSYKTPDNQLMFLLGVFALMLAYLTWRYIETPFRDRTIFTRERIFQFSAVSLIAVISVGAVGYFNSGFGNRIASDGRSFSDLDLITRNNYGLDKRCGYSSFKLLKKCSTSKKPEILIWGDSYAMHIVPGILASNPNARIIQITKSLCGPVIGMSPIDIQYSRAWAENCIDFNNNVIAWLKEHETVNYVVLGSPFSRYFGDNTVLVGDQIMPADNKLFLSHFEATLATLSEMGMTPIVFAPTPSNGDDIGRCLTHVAIYDDGIDCRIDFDTYKNENQELMDFLAEVEKKYRVIRVSDVLCDDTYCDAELDGVFIYRDAGHLSVEGSEYLGRKMDFYKLITAK